MKYSTTYASVIVGLLGFFGISGLFSEAEVTHAIDAIIVLAGFIGVIIARYNKKDVTLLGFKK